MTSMPQLYLCWGSGGGPLQYTNTLVSLALCMQPSPARKIRQIIGCEIRDRVRASVAIGELHQKRVRREVVPAAAALKEKSGSDVRGGGTYLTASTALSSKKPNRKVWSYAKLQRVTL